MHTDAGILRRLYDGVNPTRLRRMAFQEFPGEFCPDGIGQCMVLAFSLIREFGMAD
jgi:hypothetical protein